MSFVWKLKKSKNINIDLEKYPIKKPKRRIYNFTIFESFNYHKKTESNSSVIINPESEDIRETVLHLPTIEYKHYSDLQREIKTDEKYTLLKDGRPNSNSIKNYYTPHIVGKKSSKNNLIRIIRDVINYYNERDIKNIFI